jgi:hypothetical protein
MPPKDRPKFYIAIAFIASFLIVIGVLPYFLLVFGRIRVDEYKDIVLTLAGILGGPFGIIINNYFKEEQDR